MAQYAIAFDLDTKRMERDGLTRSDRTSIYQSEIPAALSLCGFTAHPQGSLYHTESEQNPINAIMQLQTTLRDNAQNFCKYVSKVHVFRMDEWSDVTEFIASKNIPSEPDELAQQELSAIES